MSKDAERLAARGRAVDWFPLCLDDPSQAQRDLEIAQNALADQQTDAAKRRVATARAALDACYRTVRLTARTRSEWDALVRKHPVPLDAEGKPVRDDDYDIDTFVPAVLAITVSTQDGEGDDGEWVPFASAELWAELIADLMSPGEVAGLWSAVMGINHRTLDPRIPKG